MMTASFSKPAYFLSFWGMTMRPWLSSSHFEALANRGRMAADWLMGREANFSVKRFQVSWG